MKPHLKHIFENSFYQLLAVYTLLVVLISLNLFWKYSLQLQILALIIAVLGIVVISKKSYFGFSSKYNKLELIIHYSLFVIAVLLIVGFRIIPYINNDILLGYDSGIYKYAIEKGLENKDSWIFRNMEPGFMYLMEFFKMFFSVEFIMNYLLIGFCLLLGISIYFVSKEYFDKKTGLIALLIYSLSVIQFKTFWYMYYKNIIGLSLALFAVYFLKKSKDKKFYIWLFIVLGGLIGAVHRPTFYIFGLSYFLYTFIDPIYPEEIKYRRNYFRYNFQLLKRNIFYGVLILIIAVLFYIGDFRYAILSMINPVLQGFVQPGESPGTFINFFTYQFSTLFYLPFALLGFFYLYKKRKFNLLFFWTFVGGVIIIFQFFFFNRFIVHLDVALIILAAAGFSVLIENKKEFGVIVLIAMLLSGGFVAYNNAKNSRPLISEEEFKAINFLNGTEKNASVMATNSIYSPWVLGYSERKTIAPGLFDYNMHNQKEWMEFWTTSDINYARRFLDVYPKPLYIYVGPQQKDNLEQFEELEIFERCFSVNYKKNDNKIYKYVC